MFDADLIDFFDHTSGVAQQAATTLVDALATSGITDGVIVDLGCGSGHLTVVVAECGFPVMAVDPSAAALRLVQRRVPEAQLVQASVIDVDLGGDIAAIACVGEVLSYDLDIDLDAAVASFHEALKPGGVLMLDVPGPGRHGRVVSTTATPTRDSYLIVRSEESGYRLRRTVTLFTGMADGSYRRSERVHDLRLYEPEDVRQALDRAGFVHIRPLERYGASAERFGSGWSAFVATRGQ